LNIEQNLKKITCHCDR